MGAYIVKDGKVLLIQENHPPDKGKWNLPAGKLDFGEEFINAAKRETHEEAGLQFTPTALLGIHSVYRRDVPGEVHALRVIFLGEASGDVSLDYGDAVDGEAEIADYTWVSPAQILAMDDALLRYHDIKSLTQNFIDNQTLPLDSIKHVVQQRP